MYIHTAPPTDSIPHIRITTSLPKSHPPSPTTLSANPSPQRSSPPTLPPSPRHPNTPTPPHPPAPAPLHQRTSPPTSHQHHRRCLPAASADYPDTSLPRRRFRLGSGCTGLSTAV